MHSTIFELQPTILKKEDWATESNFTDNYNIDYCIRLDGEAREERIKILHGCDWFLTLFRAGENDSIIYRGKDALTRLKKAWYKEMQIALMDIIYKKSCDVWKLEYAAKKPFGIDTMFCIPAWTGDDTVSAQGLLTYLEELEDNAMLHICGVFDYHF